MLYATVDWEMLSEWRIGGANEGDKDFALNFDRSLGSAIDCDKNLGATNFDRSWGGVGDGGEEGSCKGEDLHIWRWRDEFLVKVSWILWEGLSDM